jgi:hypothetical protein
MANYFVPLAAQKPGPGLNLEPVNAALDGIIQQQNQKRQFGMQQQQIDQRQAEQTYQHGRDAKQDGMQQVQLFGKQATAVDQLQGPQRTAAWSSILARHGTTNLTPEELDPVTGPKLMAAQAGQFLDPLDREIKQVGLDLTRAQIKAADQKNTLNDAIAGLISGSGGPTGGTAVPPLPQNAPNRALQAQPAPATVQPQSFESTPTMPGVVLASDTSTVPGTPAAPPTTQPELIDTPLGRMTPQRARQLGMAFALGGKGDAGKMLSDSAGSADLSKSATTQNDKEELGATGALATLNTIKNSYNAKYLNVPNRFKMWGTALKDKYGTLSDPDKKDLEGYTQFRQNAWHNLNRVLKDLSGTAVNENEMQRQLLDLPNPGQTIFDGDSPTEFAGKLRNSLAFQTSAIARSRWLRSKGFTGKPWEAGVSVEDMPAIIDQRHGEIEQQLKQSNPNATPMQLQQAADRQIKREFGI